MRIGLFFTRGNSLDTWERAGTLERELALYRWLSERGLQFTFFTYGGRDDLRFAPFLNSIAIAPNRWNLALPVYEALLPWLYAGELRACDLLKTNQAKGSHTALFAARLWRKPLIVRSGYLWSDYYARARGGLPARMAALLEALAFRGAQRLVVTAPAMRTRILRRRPDLAVKIAVIPNYVDTERFRPRPELRQENRLVYVGRLSAEKNLPALLEAIRPLTARLDVIGTGPRLLDLQARFGDLNGRVHWVGALPNAVLPERLNAASLFVLPSLHEGQPKALLEAMACGLPVLGSDVPGVRDLVHHGETGWLCPPDPKSLRAAIQRLLADPGLRARLGNAASCFAVDHFSLDRVAGLEYDLVGETIRKFHATQRV